MQTANRNLPTITMRNAYVSDHIKAFIAHQIRALRGDKSQAEFAKTVGKPQAVISRLEDPEYGRANMQTLLDIACKLDMGLIIAFVDYTRFHEFINNRAWASVTSQGNPQERIVHSDIRQIPQMLPITFNLTSS